MAQKEPAESNDARQFIQGVLETIREPLLILDEHLRVPELKRAYNKRLFTRVAGKYGFVTSALSLGRDRAWKRLLIRALPEVGRPMCVDLACGTGDITALLADRYPAGEVHGIDLKAVTKKLQHDGVAAFAGAFDDLLASLAEKIAAR